MLDLMGYTADQALHSVQILQPTFGAGSFSGGKSYCAGLPLGKDKKRPVQRSPSDPLGKNACQARTSSSSRCVTLRSVRTCPPTNSASSLHSGVPASVPLRAPRVGSPLWHGSFASGASGRAAPVSCDTLRSSSPHVARSFVDHSAKRIQSTRRLILSATCLRRPASIYNLTSAPLPSYNQGRPAGSWPAASRRAFKIHPCAPLQGNALAAAYPRPTLGAAWRRWRLPSGRPLLSRPEDRQFLATLHPTSLSAYPDGNLSFLLASATLPPYNQGTA